MPASADETVLRLRVIYVDPPDGGALGALFGLQERGAVIHEGRRVGADLQYDLEVFARWEPGRQRLRFRGPWVQGTPDAPFLYISWRPADPTPDSPTWLWRSKISLANLTLSQMERARHTPESVLSLRVPGRAAKSGPATGTLRPLDDGWSLDALADFSPIAPP